MTKLDLGEHNGHSVGRILKEAVRRAMVAIRNERASFVAQVKMGHAGNMDDVFTSADTKAQEIYLRTFDECFPRCGVIGEEDSLFISPEQPDGPYFTVDPLDGTKAFVRRQSHGVGTMVALVQGQEVISAYVGDINANEVYGFRPDSLKVHRITDLDTFEELSYSRGLDPAHSHGLLRDPEKKYSPLVHKFLATHCENYSVDGGSIGIWMARLWKGEVAAVVLRPGIETPWDGTPIIGISRKLGYAFFRSNPEGTRWVPYEPRLSMEKFHRDHETLIVHGSETHKIV